MSKWYIPPPDELSGLLSKQSPKVPYIKKQRHVHCGDGKLTWSVPTEAGKKGEERRSIDFSKQPCVVEEVQGSGCKFELRPEGGQWQADENFTGVDQGRSFIFDVSDSAESLEMWIETVQLNIIYGKELRAKRASSSEATEESRAQRLGSQIDKLNGLLWKQSPKFPYKSQQRYISLGDGKMIWSLPTKVGGKGEEKGCIDFNIQRCLAEEVNGSDARFELRPADGQWLPQSGEAFTGFDQGRTFAFDVTDSGESRETWLDVIRQNIILGKAMQTEKTSASAIRDGYEASPQPVAAPANSVIPAEVSGSLWKQSPKFPYSSQQRYAHVSKGVMTWSLLRDGGGKGEERGRIDFFAQRCIVEEVEGSDVKFLIRPESGEWKPDEKFTGADQGRVFTFDASGSPASRSGWLDAISQNIRYAADLRGA